MPEIPINFVAILLAAIAYMIVGMLWYGPLFGKQWKTLMGYTDETVMKMTPIKSMIGGFIAALIMSNVLWHSAYVWNEFFGSSISQGQFVFQLAFWIWLGYVATTQAGAVLWENRPWKLFFINASNTLVGILAMSAVITYMM